MDTTLIPTRYVLDQQQLAAALTLGNIRPGDRSSIPSMPRVTEPHQLLRETELLDADNNQLTDEAEATLRVAADPACVISVLANHAGTPDWRESVFFGHGDDDGPFVIQAMDEAQFDVALIPTATQATLLVDDLLGLSGLAAEPGESSFTLSLAGYGAALAAADVMQSRRYAARLERVSPEMPILTPAALEDALQEGLSYTDTRWAVTAGRMVCPAVLKAVVGSMSSGLAELQEAGLVETVQDGYQLTVLGYDLAASLGEIVVTGCLSLGVSTQERQLTVGYVNIFRCTTALWCAVWTEMSDTDAKVDLMQISAAGALGLVRCLLAATSPVEASTPDSSAPAPCESPECDHEFPLGKKFCPRCGWRRSVKETSKPSKDRMCPHCGGAACVGKKFCSQTGKPLPADQNDSDSQPAVRVCPNPECRKDAEPKAKFCRFCGARIVSKETP